MSQQAPNTETLKFKIGLSGTYWDKRPDFTIWIDDTKYAAGTISMDSGVVEYMTFLADFIEGFEYSLKIRLENKEQSDTLQNEDCTEILKDMLLNIESIEIDDINLNQLKWTKSKFIPDDSANRPLLENCINLGWNGAYTLQFDTPFYLWLLENS